MFLIYKSNTVLLLIIENNSFKYIRIVCFWWAKDLNRHFIKEYVPWANKHIQRWLTSLLIREKQIKIIMRPIYFPTRWLVIKTNTKYWQGFGANVLSGGRLNWNNHFENWHILVTVNICLFYLLATLHLSIYKKQFQYTLAVECIPKM